MFEPWHRELLAECRTGHLATIAPSGIANLVPVCYSLVGDAIVIAIDEKPKRGGELARIANIRHDPRVTFLADRYDHADWTRLAWVRIEGEATIVVSGALMQDALTALRSRYRQYNDMALESRPLIRIQPRRVVSWRADTPG